LLHGQGPVVPELCRSGVLHYNVPISGQPKTEGPAVGKRAMDELSLRDEFLKLTRIGIALTSLHKLDQLLEMIVREARAFTRADAGSLYLREGDRLVFAVSQNDTLTKRLGEEEERAKFSAFSIPISQRSIAGYVASTKQNLNIPDVYAIPGDAPYHFNPEFDERNDYRTRSILAVPMEDHLDEVIGVLQLINALQGDAAVPFSPSLEELVRSIASQAAVAVNNARLTAEIKRVHLDTIYRLSVAAEYKDHDTAAHIRRMSQYTAALAQRMGWVARQTELLLYASPMHDVGKIGIPDAILLKPGKLTPEERKVMEEHTLIGSRILSGSESELLKLSEVVALTHHEKWNGSGYPCGLKGAEIPQCGRITAVADVFDALCSRRVYKSDMDTEAAFDIIKKDSGSHFDPECVEAFWDIRDSLCQIRAQHAEK